MPGGRRFVPRFAKMAASRDVELLAEHEDAPGHPVQCVEEEQIQDQNVQGDVRGRDPFGSPDRYGGGAPCVASQRGKTVLRKILGPIVLGLVLLAGVAMPATALAGEITGNGKLTPIELWGGGHADPSFCAFSGLEDGTSEPFNQPPEPDVVPFGPGSPDGPAVTQTPHSENGVIFDPGVAADRDRFNCIGRMSWQDPR